MLWRKQGNKDQEVEADGIIRPADLGFELDKNIVISKLNGLLEAAADKGGVEPFTDALRAKHEMIATAFPVNSSEMNLTQESLDAVLEIIFPARRKLAQFFAETDQDNLIKELKLLVYGEDSINDRIDRFCELIPASNEKIVRRQRRALWEFSAEILHFRDPELMPFMARWIWDVNTDSGAVREITKASDAVEKIPLGMTPEDYQGVRAWLAGVLAEEGFYRDVAYLMDLVLAQAYADYVKAMSTGIGMVDAEFASQQDPLDFLTKLLGIDPSRKDGQTRLKRQTIH